MSQRKPIEFIGQVTICKFCGCKSVPQVQPDSKATAVCCQNPECQAIFEVNRKNYDVPKPHSIR